MSAETKNFFFSALFHLEKYRLNSNAWQGREGVKEQVWRVAEEEGYTEIASSGVFYALHCINRQFYLLLGPQKPKHNGPMPFSGAKFYPSGQFN